MKASALLTSMDMPIGKCIGNSLEVLECVAALNKPEEMPAHLKELVLSLGIINTAFLIHSN